MDVCYQKKIENYTVNEWFKCTVSQIAGCTKRFLTSAFMAVRNPTKNLNCGGYTLELEMNSEKTCILIVWGKTITIAERARAHAVWSTIGIAGLFFIFTTVKMKGPNK